MLKEKININDSYQLDEGQINFYRENEFIKLKNVFTREEVGYYKDYIFRKTLELNTNLKPMEERNTYDKAFIQVINLWRECEKVKEFVFGRRLAGIAAALMEVDGVRLYHDQALFKEGKGGFTPWHADQQYWPLATDKTITAWIPLQEVTMDMGPLSFAGGSHKVHDFRGLEISDDSEGIIGKFMEKTDVECSAYELGEVSFHSGWMYHRAPANTSGKMRGVMTVIYMDKDMVLKEPENSNQVHDGENFCPGIKVGELCDSELNPVLFG